MASFPVQVTNQLSGTPNDAYVGGTGNNAYGLQLSVTRTAIEAAPSSSIGNLFSLNGGFGPQPGKAAVMVGFTICSTKPASFQIRVGVATGPLSGANIPEKDYAFVVNNADPVYIPCNWVIRNGLSVIAYITKLLNPSDTETVVTFSPDVYVITDDFNYNARKTIEWVGTSITNGSGPTSTGTMYHTLLLSYLRKVGKSVRQELYGISGSTTATHYSLFTKGAYDVTMNKVPPDVLVIELGVNDASAGTVTATYTQRLQLYAERFLTNPEKANIMVLILGATPLENTTAYNNSVTLDAAASALVTTMQGTYPNRIFFVPLSSSFDRLVASNYASTDTPGSRIHPSDQGCQAIMTNGFETWLATAQGQTFLQRLS